MNKRYVFLLALGLAFWTFTFSVSGAGICPFIDGGGASGDISPFPDGGWPSGDISPFPDDGSASGEPCPFDDGSGSSGDISPFPDDGSASGEPCPFDDGSGSSGDISPFPDDGSASGEPCPFVLQIPGTTSAQNGVDNISSTTAVPTDPDNDGLYEDLNGNGECDFADVILFFNQMEWIIENEPVGAFDYNGNGQVDFCDLIMLFSRV